ncbi:MAG: DUF1045 domain-containing protein [Candidatus Aminicenantes bacterium]|nr:DUF1045 domain-containing protein [Candidatus Aminicenantes bacterium]
MKDSVSYKNYFDVVITPPAPVKEYVIQISQKIAKQEDGEFVLGKTRFVPHISLFHIPIKKAQLPEIKQKIKKVLSDSRLGLLRLKKITVLKETLVWIQVSRPQWLVNLHCKIVQETMPFRDPDFDAMKAWSNQYNSSQKKLIKIYGSPYVGRFFIPHITLTVLNLKNANPGEIPFKPKKFRVSSISLYQLGPHHSCEKRIFTLKKPK